MRTVVLVRKEDPAEPPPDPLPPPLLLPVLDLLDPFLFLERSNLRIGTLDYFIALENNFL